MSKIANKPKNIHREDKLYQAGDMYVRNVVHDFSQYTNTNKNNDISLFIDEYRKFMILACNELFNNPYSYEINNVKFTLDIKRNKIPNILPKYLQTQNLHCKKYYKGLLSGRSQSTVATQLIGIIRGCIKVAKDRGESIKKPNLDNILPEIPSKFISFIDNPNQNSIFKRYMVLRGLLLESPGKRGSRKVLYIPIKTHKMNDKYEVGNNKMMGSFLLSKGKVCVRYIICNTKQRINNDILGVDPGINKLCSLSNGDTTDNLASDGKTIDQIFDKIKRKQKNSKAYKRSIIERDCCINHSINKIDFTKYGKLNVENNKGLKANTSNANHNWSLDVIYDKLLRKCQDDQVDISLVPSAYKSRRCYECGFVHKKNRKKEEFKCINCHHECDADINAAMNNSLNLDYSFLWGLDKSTKDCGFFWEVISI